MKTIIHFYEGSYQFDSISTEQEDTEAFIENQLSKQFNYRNTEESLWAIVIVDGKELARFQFLNGLGLQNITIAPSPPATASGHKRLQLLRKLTWSDFLSPCYDPQEHYGDFSGTILDILRDERIPANDRVWAMTREGFLDDRTLRLFACKCLRSTPLADGGVLWDLLKDERSREAVDVTERFANGEATTTELFEASAQALQAAGRTEEMNRIWAVRAVRAANAAAWNAAEGAADAAARAAWNAADDVRELASKAQVQFAIELIETNYEC